jgi:hypothetical protein
MYPSPDSLALDAVAKDMLARDRQNRRQVHLLFIDIGSPQA